MPQEPTTTETTAETPAANSTVRIRITARGIVLNGHKKAPGRIEDVTPAQARALVADGAAHILY